jgi:hypothetical protein
MKTVAMESIVRSLIFGPQNQNAEYNITSLQSVIGGMNHATAAPFSTAFLTPLKCWGY